MRSWSVFSDGFPIPEWSYLMPEHAQRLAKEPQVIYILASSLALHKETTLRIVGHLTCWALVADLFAARRVLPKWVPGGNH